MNINISYETQTLVEVLNSRTSLRKTNDFALLIEIASNNQMFFQINQLATIGKNVVSLLTILKKSSPGDQIHGNVEQEFAQYVNLMRELLLNFGGLMSQSEYQRFDEIYFRNNQGALRNIVDLATLKNLQNDNLHQSSTDNNMDEIK